jgi:hypothetical protein
MGKLAILRLSAGNQLTVKPDAIKDIKVLETKPSNHPTKVTWEVTPFDGVMVR